MYRIRTVMFLVVSILAICPLQSRAKDLIIDGSATVPGGQYGFIFVKNGGSLTIDGDTSAQEILLRAGTILIKGNVVVKKALTIEQSSSAAQLMTVHGNENQAQRVRIMGGTLRVLGRWTVSKMWIGSEGKIQLISPDSQLTDAGRWVLQCEQLIVKLGGLIDAYAVGNDRRGVGGGYGNACGGGHGGRGGRGYWDDIHPGEIYGDDYSSKIGMGAQGGGYGGGGVTIIATDQVVLAGTINANGETGEGGGGSGGGVLIKGSRLNMSGRIEANGGDGNYFHRSGGGGGGRIKLFFDTLVDHENVPDRLSVKGGLPGGYTNATAGGDGIIWLNAIPRPPTLLAPMDGAVLTSNHPSFRFAVVDYSVEIDNRDDDLSGLLEFSTDHFATVYKIYDQNISVDGWSQPSYRSGDQARFTLPEPLPDGTYQWRVRIRDKSITSRASEIRTVTIR